ncbi:MAG TPA: hypothetical protein VGO51_12135 [Burkholderiaceae bacterium]|jgi:hypothetical protein|nr:hypothetical protein [Burkholderiaceae bacterium]
MLQNHGMPKYEADNSGTAKSAGNRFRKPNELSETMYLSPLKLFEVYCPARFPHGIEPLPAVLMGALSVVTGVALPIEAFVSCEENLCLVLPQTESSHRFCGNALI